MCYISADDCFELGRQSYYNEDFYHTVLWMQESLRKYDLEKNDKNLFKWEILEYLAFSLFKEGKRSYKLLTIIFLISEQLCVIGTDRYSEALVFLRTPRNMKISSAYVHYAKD